MSKLKVNVLDYGVHSGTDKIQTKSFQDAIDFCFDNGGGEVVVPEGVYVIGDIRLRSNITLHLLENAVLKGSINPDDYLNVLNDKIEPLPEKELYNKEWKSASQRTPEESLGMLDGSGSRWNYGMIRILFAENVSIIGEKGSVIDGCNCYDEKGEEYYRGPHGINAHKSQNLYFKGYTIKNTGNWAHCIFTSQNITVEKVTVLAGHDGIHFRGCDNAVVKDCVVKTGDDAVAGFDNINVIVKDCDFESACNTFRFGGTNVRIENCISRGPCTYPFRGSLTLEEKAKRVEDSETSRKNNASFFTYIIDASRKVRYTPGNIVVKNCSVINAYRFFRLNLSGSEVWQKGLPPENVTFENIKAEGIRMHITAFGNDDIPFELSMKNIEYSFDKDNQEAIVEKSDAPFNPNAKNEKQPINEEVLDTAFIHAGKFGKINLENINISNFKGDTFIRLWDEKEKVVLKNVKCDKNVLKNIVKMEEEFGAKYL